MEVQPIHLIKIFFCYAHEDNTLREQLARHLSPLRRLRHITGWFDRDIEAGTDWQHEIETHLDTASIILLLVSADFIASDYCYTVEMKLALEKHKAGTAHVIPIILRPVAWEETPIGELSALPRGKKPVTQWADQDEAWLNVVQGIREVVRTSLPQQILSPSETSILYPEQIPPIPSLPTTPEVSSPATNIQRSSSSSPSVVTGVPTQTNGAVSSARASLSHTAQPIDTSVPPPLPTPDSSPNASFASPSANQQEVTPAPVPLSTSKQPLRLLLVFGVPLVAILFLLVASLVPKSNVETRIFSFSVQPKLSVMGNFASIYVHPADISTGFDILVKATKATRLIDFTSAPVDYIQQGNTLLISPNGPSSGTSNIDLDIKAPPTAVVQVDSSSYPDLIRIDGINGGVTVSTNNSASDVTLNNVNGQIIVEEGGSGSFTATNVNGQVITTTGVGNIDLNHSTLKGRSSLKTTSGNIIFNGSIDPNGAYQVETGSGDINFTLPSNASFTLHTSTTSGLVKNEFGSNDVGNAPRPTLTFTTDSGDINLAKGP